MIPTPQAIESIGIATATILTAWQARTAAKVRDLETRLAAVESERDRFRRLFRAAVRHIRDWMAWGMTHAPGTPPPPLPPELLDEV